MNIVVFCIDVARAEAWVERLLPHFEEVWCLDSESYVRYAISGATPSSLEVAYRRDWSDPPPDISVTIEHTGDRALEVYTTSIARLGPRFRFCFNALGYPEPFAEGMHPVYKVTEEGSFSVTADDAREIAEYVSEQRKELPACCFPPPSVPLLFALYILCQGFLIAKVVIASDRSQPIRDLSESAHHALADMGWSEGLASLLAPDLQVRSADVRGTKWWQVLGKDAPELLQKEWNEGGEDVGENGWKEINALLLHVFTDQSASRGNGVEEARQPLDGIDPAELELVARAYLALASRIH